MFITASAPSKRSLGATNGLSQTSVSLSRAIGPAFSTTLFAYGIDHNVLGGNAAYALFITLSVVSMLAAAQLPRDPWAREVED
jgi:hypothetical protein